MRKKKLFVKLKQTVRKKAKNKTEKSNYRKDKGHKIFLKADYDVSTRRECCRLENKMPTKKAQLAFT